LVIGVTRRRPPRATFVKLFEGVFRFPSPNLIGIPADPLRNPAYSQTYAKETLRIIHDVDGLLPASPTMSEADIVGVLRAAL
jgi:hypothetical protein